MSGCITLLVNAVTNAVNAVPMTTATARSITLPREMKSLNPFNMGMNLSLGRLLFVRCRRLVPIAGPRREPWGASLAATVSTGTEQRVPEFADKRLAAVIAVVLVGFS